MILQHKGINIFYTDKGTGVPVVLLHGFLENSTMWDAFIPVLSKKNRIICIDLLGHGQTDCLGYIHSMELMAEIVKAVLNHLNISQTILIGHSMGGYVALAFAENNPKNVIGLCLMNSTANADSSERKKNRDRAIIAVKQNHKTFVRIAVVNLFRPKNRKIFANQIKLIKEQALKIPVQGIVAALEGMKIRKDREQFFKNAAFEKLMIISKKDPVLAFKSLIKQTKNSNIKVVEFPDGHMSHVENETLFLRTIVHFIEKI
ncbi:alpha/beta hydrolase [Gaetbulibacter aquiaggeris]|uniref:Alpha/beta hydrolase n=1 Tax=Gaetbulibacter aquiaggeris TaxID=1735373 RepID=A0ABW7MPF0_9FLAO